MPEHNFFIGRFEPKKLLENLNFKKIGPGKQYDHEVWYHYDSDIWVHFDEGETLTLEGLIRHIASELGAGTHSDPYYIGSSIRNKLKPKP